MLTPETIALEKTADVGGCDQPDSLAQVLDDAVYWLAHYAVEKIYK